MYPDRRLTWNFYGHYETLNKILMEAAPGAITVSIKICSADYVDAALTYAVSCYLAIPQRSLFCRIS